jgi:hypothetical protein
MRASGHTPPHPRPLSREGRGVTLCHAGLCGTRRGRICAGKHRLECPRGALAAPPPTSLPSPSRAIVSTHSTEGGVSGNVKFRRVLRRQPIRQAADSPGGAAACSPGRKSGVIISRVSEAPEGRHPRSGWNWRKLPLKRHSDVAPPGLGLLSAEILGLTPQATRCRRSAAYGTCENSTTTMTVVSSYLCRDDWPRGRGVRGCRWMIPFRDLVICES